MASRRVIGRLYQGGLNRLVVVAGLAGVVVGVYVVVVLGGGALIGRTDSPSLPLSVVATAAVALLFAPAQAALERSATSMGRDGAAPPYEVLSRFSETVTGGYPTEELPVRMARLLAQGTGAQWAQVWLIVSGHLTLAATWPPDADDVRTPPEPQPDARDATDEGRRAVPVRHGGQPLGVLRLCERPGLPLTSVEERLFTGLAAQAGLVLRLVGLRAELKNRHHDLAEKADELKASRERLIETQDAERRRLERDLHDGAQQHLVALAVNLRLAQTIAARSPERIGPMLAQQADAAREAIETLATLSRGIYPRLLSDEGLAPALHSAVADCPIPVIIETDAVGRLPEPVEAALYFCCMEAVQNAAKHSGAEHVTVQLGEAQRQGHLVVSDNGTGFDQARASALESGTGLLSMRDRLSAVGGNLTVTSSLGSGTTITAIVPIPRDPARISAHHPFPRREG